MINPYNNRWYPLARFKQERISKDNTKGKSPESKNEKTRGVPASVFH